MTLSIQNPEADRLAHTLADMRGVSLDDAVLDALKVRISQEERRKKEDSERRLLEVKKIVQKVAKLPVLDNRTPDEIIGFDENGLPK